MKRNLLVRIPEWVPADSVSWKVDGQSIELKRVGAFALIDRSHLPARVELEYALPLRKEKETAAGTEYETTWRGEEVVGISPNTDFYPFYPTADGE